MARVSPIERAGIAVAPSSRAAKVPASVAPAVFAIVLRIRIADVGRAISRFIPSKRFAFAPSAGWSREASRTAFRVE